MTVADHTIRWTHRLNGEDPASPAGQNNGAWDSTVAGTRTDDLYWRVSGAGYNTLISTDSSYQTAVVTLRYNSTPADGTLLASLDSGSYEIQVLSTGATDSLKIDGSGATPQTITGLDLTKPTMFRITLNNDVGRLYPFDLIESESGDILYKEITTTGTSTVNVSFGCDDGIVDFGNFYYTSNGAFTSDEFSPSIWCSNSLQQIGLRIVEILQNSDRMYLKTQVTKESIVYAHDLSPRVVARFEPPTIFVVVPTIRADPESLGGGTVMQDFRVQVFVMTKAADYKYAHRLCMELSGEVVEEIYSESGQNDNKDAITGFNSEIDMRQEEDEIICVNSHTFDYRRRINYRER
jgi:hypothetical protein